ncbi:putative teichuronic acid biosynthesis glycosyltransferase TuaC [mine drainage metagenome]|uniref:Putative teichuronic acid biosynthesis glycosyltransferase TuaC n=1 Tax=mine drainage metagenome TaxID=410659 RepID=A0A1J5PVM9_9ZZZZ
MRKLLIDKVGGMRKGFEGAQDLDMFLRVAEITSPDKIRHIPQIAYHWRSHDESTASQGTQKTYVFDSADRAIREALKRRGLNAEPFLPQIARKYGMCLNQLRWIDSIGQGKEVTILIPTKDRVDLLERCINSLYKTCDKRFVKILIMDDRSTDLATLKYFQELENNSPMSCRVVRPRRGDGTFNYARLINEAVDYVDTPYILQLNNDVEAIEPGWLEDMMGWMSIDDVGVVGAKLLYQDHTVQHAGVVIGPHGGLADHQFYQLPERDVGYLALAHATRNVSAVTGACMLITTELFRKLNGFDEINFAVEFNDVDFCLRTLESGKRVVCTPQARLTHLTSATRGNSYNPQEHINFITKYKQFKDCFYNSNIRKDSMWMPVDGDHFAHADRVKKIRILLISHALSLTGAPIAAYEFVRYFATAMGFEVTVLALQDGPVHQMYDELRIPVIVTHELENVHLLSAIKLQATLQRINNLIHLADEFDLVVCNTLTTFWGVMMANQSRIPAIWHIHESVGAEKYASKFLDTAIGNMVALAFFKATRVVFQANATRVIFNEFEAIANFDTIPGGLPLQRIEIFRQANSKSVLRKKYGIQDDAYVVILVGTTCERKGQAVFLDAIDQMCSDGIPSNVSFLIVGAIEGLYLECLKEKIAQLNLRNVQLVAETKEIYDYYVLSDLFVCASFEESFPMVVLLAMAFELPIVSTNVFGIPEIVSDQQEALLFPPGESQSMAAAILQCMNDPDETNAMVARAYAKVKRLFDSELLLMRHAELARKVATEDVLTTIH